MALLDFGATRGFDEKFTDVYIEVRSCTVSWRAALDFANTLSCYHFVLKYTLGVEGSRAGGKRAISVPVSSLAMAVCAHVLQSAGSLSWGVHKSELQCCLLGSLGSRVYQSTQNSVGFI